MCQTFTFISLFNGHDNATKLVSLVSLVYSRFYSISLYSSLLYLSLLYTMGKVVLYSLGWPPAYIPPSVAPECWDCMVYAPMSAGCPCFKWTKSHTFCPFFIFTQELLEIVSALMEFTGHYNIRMFQNKQKILLKFCLYHSNNQGNETSYSSSVIQCDGGLEILSSW